MGGDQTVVYKKKLCSYVQLQRTPVNNEKSRITIIDEIFLRSIVLTDHGQIVSETARLTLPEIHSASVCRRIVPLYIVDHQNRRARKSGSEKGPWTENAGVR